MSQRLAIIDYGSGNLRSAEKAFSRVIRDLDLDIQITVTDRAEDILGSDRIVLPGQGAFGDCMAGLRALPGVVDALHERVRRQGVPFFGICVGMQLLASRGYEFGVHDGLGWIPGDVVPMTPRDSTLKIPHMGWNDVTLTESGRMHPVLRRVMESSPDGRPHFYFVHSFMFESKDRDCVLSTTDYGGHVNAVIGVDNILGVQFHPEKSQKAGLDLIAGFLTWKP